MDDKFEKWWGSISTPAIKNYDSDILPDIARLAWNAAIESIDDEVYNRAATDCAKCSLEQNKTCVHAIALSNCKFWRKLEG